ncbi:MAG TPA: PQQ-binding-like beta-propeller repeat protein, partial [Bacteroidia bacterium]|nr:PQQ-binding-like beta-propeller repeat protein [Bacteroidia bacterium]
WAYIMGDKGIFGPPLSADGNYLFQGCWDHNVYAITSTGTLKWKYPTHGCVSYNMALTPGGSLVVGGGDAHCGTDTLMYCIGNTETSSPITLWTYQGPFSHWSGPAIGRNGLIYISMSPRLYVFDTLGNFKWSIGGPANVAGVITPGLYGDTTAASTTIYTGDFQGRFFSISAATQDTTWVYQTGKDPVTKIAGIPCFPVVDKKGDVYFGAADYNVYALNKSGTKLWSYATGGEITEASPAIDPETGTLYITSGDGYVYAFQDSAATTGINNVESANIELQVSPNPANNKLTLTADYIMQSGTQILLYTIMGQLVINKQLDRPIQSVEVNTGNLVNGIYMLRLQLPDGSIANKKIEIIK